MFKRSLKNKPKRSMKSVGQILREKRKKRGLTTREVAEITKVREKYLTALEEDDYSLFASPVYLKGFLRNYAKFLDIPVEHIIAVYRRDTESRKEQAPTPTSGPIKESSFVITPQLVLTIITTVFIIGIVGYLVSQYYVLKRPPDLTISEPKDGEVVHGNLVTIKGKTITDATVTVNGKTIGVDNSGNFEAEVSLEEGTNTIVIKSKDPTGVGEEAVKKINVFYEILEEDSAEEEPATDGTVPKEESKAVTELKIILEIGPENAWIELSIDGTRKIANILTAGEKREYTSKESLYLITGKISSTTLTVNGQVQPFTDQTGVGRLECKLDESPEEGFVCQYPQ